MKRKSKPIKLILSGKVLNLADNMAIVSDVFNVGSNGKVSIRGNNQATDLLRIENLKTSDFMYCSPDSWGIVRDSGSIYAAAEGENFDKSFIELSGSNGVTNLSNTGITTPTLTQTSREENKKNFEKLENALNILKQTEIYKYNLKSQKDGDKKHIGFVIGKNYKYSHELTAEDDSGKEIGVDNYSMTSVLWKAMQEQQEIIEQLQKEVEELKGGQDK